jgi:hypothetical protein
MTPSNSRTNIVRLMIVFGLLSMTFCTSIFNGNIAYSLPPSPQQQPIPKPDYDDPAKSIVVLLTFRKLSPSSVDIDNATLVSVNVSPERARTHAGDPRLLIVHLLDVNETVVNTFDTWNPLWTFYYDENGKEHLQIEQKANGTIVFPFDQRLALMDLYTPREKFIIRVNLTQTVQDFCRENPNDPDCRPILLGAGVR